MMIRWTPTFRNADRTPTGSCSVARDPSSDHWDPLYRSMLVYAIDGNVITENTAVFFEARKAVMTAIPESEREESGREPAP